MRVRSLLLLSLLSTGCFATNQKIGPTPSNIPLEAARETVRSGLAQQKSWLDKKQEFHTCCATASEILIRTQGISYVHTTPAGSEVVRLSLDQPITAYDSFNAGFSCLTLIARLGGYRGDTPIGFGTSGGIYFTKTKDDLLRFAHAYNTLVAYKREHGEEEFAARANAWRAMNPRPPLSQEGEKHRILAENAFREKNVDKAIAHFEAALEADPTWPDGNFNLALLYGESKQYALAALHMKRFLLLVPESKDAKGAKEKIIIWEDKAKQ